MKYGIQMYSLRDITGTEMERALHGVSEMGYAYVEFAGFFGYSAQKIRAWLDKYNLRVSGTHTGWQELDDDHFVETVAYHKAIGNSNIIIPGADLTTAANLNEFITFVNRVQPKLAAEGITLGYHNHHHEFLPNKDGQIIHTELERRTNLLFEIDTYLAYFAGQDPLALLDRLKDRVPVIHLKDGLEDGTGKPLGAGSAPVAKVWAKADKLGILMVVESETMQPDGLTEAKVCIDYLRSLEK